MNNKKKALRIAVLWTELSGYFNACLQELKNRHQVDLLVFRIARSGANAHPYNDGLFAWMPELHTLPNGSNENVDQIRETLAEFSPNVALVSGWSVPAYRSIVRELRKGGVYVISGLDNPWRGTKKQWLGVMGSRFYVRYLFDAMWVPGERAGIFARKLGFSGRKLLYGLYSANRPSLEPIAKWRMQQQETSKGWPSRFLFVGRYVEIKGIPELLTAYQRYRNEVEAPWELWCAGSGPLEEQIERTAGVRNLGFVQPDQLGDVLKQTGVFVLPSRRDPWPLVIHEATSAGMPILCSRQCGSSVELVQEGYNGFRFEAGDVDALVKLMIRLSDSTLDLRKMGERSFILSARFSPQQWADHLVEHLQTYVFGGMA